jgi:hypothetical protein
MRSPSWRSPVASSRPKLRQRDSGLNRGEAGLAALLHPAEEAGKRVLDALQRPPAHIHWIGAVAVGIVGTDDGEALLLIDAGDRLARQTPSVAPLLERGVVQEALPLQPLVEQTVLGRGRPKLLAVRQDHTAKLEQMRNTSRPKRTLINPKRRRTLKTLERSKPKAPVRRPSARRASASTECPSARAQLGCARAEYLGRRPRRRSVGTSWPTGPDRNARFRTRRARR